MIHTDKLTFHDTVAPAITLSLLLLCCLTGCRQGEPNATVTPASEPPAAPDLSECVPIHAIQGSSHVSPMKDQEVAIKGVVTRLNKRSGFWLQDSVVDDNLATSEATYVRIQKKAYQVTLGDQLYVRGTVREIIDRRHPNGLATTTLVAETLHLLAAEQPLPSPVVIGNGGRRLPTTSFDDDSHGMVGAETPFDPESDTLDFWESLEGMRVAVPNAKAISGLHYGSEYAVVADAGAHAGPFSARGSLLRLVDDANPERVLLSTEGLNMAAPESHLTVGARFTQTHIGVVHYDWGAYKVMLALPVPTPLPVALKPERTQLAHDANALSLATFNVQNLNASAEFADGQRRVSAIAQIIANHLDGPDIVALQEVQDNSGSTNNGMVQGDRTFAALIRQIPQPAYRFCELAPDDMADGGQPGGNIRCGFLYNPERVQLLGTAPGEASQLVRLGINHPAFHESRKPLVAKFRFGKQQLTVVNCHFSSKRGDTPLMGRYQPPRRLSERVRKQQAQVVAEFIRELRKTDPKAQIVVCGDLNDFGYSDSLAVLKSTSLRNLMDKLPSDDHYTYNYRGNAQALDHIFVSGELYESAKLDIVHVNSEFSADRRASDHDPLLMQLRLPSNHQP